jgi:secreted trypsin-like serine protease
LPACSPHKISIPSKNKRIIIIKKETTTMKLAIASFLLLSSFAQSKQPTTKKTNPGKLKQAKTKALKTKALKTKALKHKHVAAESRIVGGTEATPGDYPFFGKLRFVYLIQRLFWFMDCGILTLSLTNIFAVEWEEACGAVLIHDDIILSAAHCNVITEGTVLVGAHRSFSNEENAEFRTIVDRRPHPSYHSMTLEYDFLVMKLDQAVSLFVCTKRK